MRAFATQHHVDPPSLLGETIASLTAYDWPGNVRELKNVIERLVIRTRNGVVMPADLPREISGAWPQAAVMVRSTSQKPKSDVLFERMSIARESFWSVVYEPFMSRDLTRQDVRAIITRGLAQTRGSYKSLVQLFNLQPQDYKRFLSFLRKYECHMPFQQFRSLPLRLENASEERLVG